MKTKTKIKNKLNIINILNIIIIYINKIEIKFYNNNVFSCVSI